MNKKKQHERLTNTLNALLTFANANNATCIYFEPPINSDEVAMCAVQISHELWDNESLIGKFLTPGYRYPPYRCADKRLASQWVDALHGPVICMETHGNKALILCEGSVFEVVSFGRPWDNMVPYTPDMIVTTLLPIDNVISFDGLVLNHKCPIEGPGVQRIQREFEEGRKRGIICDSDRFAEEVRRIKNLWRTKGLDPTSYWVYSDMIDQLNELLYDTCFPYELNLPMREWGEAS